MDTAEQNRQNARQIFLNSPYSNPGPILTGNTGEVKFAQLPEVDEAGDDYLMARWEETCSRAGPGVDWLEYGKRFNLWFRGQLLQLFEKQTPKSSWQPKQYFSVENMSFSISTENFYGRFHLDEEQPLPTVKQGDHIWAMQFNYYYGHHFGSISYNYDMTIDLEKMEVRYLTSDKFEAD